MGSKPRKLILHIDVNNTILVGDSKTKLTALEGVLNEYITEILWGSVDDGAWIPTENPISTKPPNTKAKSYYKYAEKKFKDAGKERCEFKKHVRRFTLEDVGKQFRWLVEKVKKSLKFTGNLSASEFQDLEPLFMKEKDGIYFRIIPAYFKLLNHLLDQNRDFAVILRTFGADGPIALEATKLYTQSLHPDISFPSSKDLPVILNPGKILPSNEGMCIRTSKGGVYSTYEKIYQEFSLVASGVQLYEDSYDWWKKNDFASAAGKPLLVDLNDSTVHHILFDDNIRAWDPWDNIVNLLVKERQHFEAKQSQEYLDGICMLRTDLFESILNENYFIEKVNMCEANFSQYLSTVKE